MVGTGKKMIISTSGVLESNNGMPSGGLVKKRFCILPRHVSEGRRLEVHTLFNPTPEQFLEAKRVVQPNSLYIQGQQLEDEKEIGSVRVNLVVYVFVHRV